MTDASDEQIEFPFPLGLVWQWRNDEWRRYARENNIDLATVNKLPKVEVGIQTALIDWQAKFHMLLWQTRRVLEDYRTASPSESGFSVSLGYDLAYWIITLRMCYDCLAHVFWQMMDEADRGQVPGASYNRLLKTYSNLARVGKVGSLGPLTQTLFGIVLTTEASFKELKKWRDELIHFVGGKVISRPKEIEIRGDGTGTLYFSFITNRGPVLAPIKKLPIQDNVRHHFRELCETASRSQVCFLENRKAIKQPGYVIMLPSDVADFLDVRSIATQGSEAWVEMLENEGP